ncbi:MAG: Hsp70 family protein [Chloroflexota bacterium]
MSKVIGIDLGTTMSAMAVIDEVGRPKMVANSDGDTLTPSAILIKGNDRVVGSRAKRSAKARPESVAQLVKRHMNEGDWVFTDKDGQKHRPEELSALILKKLKQGAEKALGEPVTKAVITVPAYFGDLERNRTKQAGEIAGFEVLGIINEPTAAAIAYGIDKGERNSTILVYDLGGGTFDVTVMQVVDAATFRVLASEGNKYLGGFDFDDALCDYCANWFQDKHGVNPLDDPQSRQDLYESAEIAKKELSSDSETDVYINGGGKSDVLEISRETFEGLIKSAISETEYLTKKVLGHEKVKNEKIDKVLLVGGSTRIPVIRERIQALIGLEPEDGFNPDEVVAMGAAIFAASKSNVGVRDGKSLRLLPPVDVQDVTAHALGILAHDSNKGGELQNFVIIPKHSELPIEIKRAGFTTHVDDQTSVSIPVAQGESPDPEMCRRVGEAAVLSGIPPQPQGMPQIEITLAYDESGIVRLFAKELKSGSDVQVDIEYKALMSDQEVARATARLNAAKVK